MEAGSQQQPLKVCRHCSVASRTDAEACPNCGRSYARGGFRWRWWYAIPIVAAAFAIGYFGISELVWEDDEGVVTSEEANAIEPGAPRTEVLDALGEPSQSAGGPGTISCDYYAIEGLTDDVWEFCFQEDVLVTSRQTGAPGD